jgi:hypothetical protein
LKTKKSLGSITGSRLSSGSFESSMLTDNPVKPTKPSIEPRDDTPVRDVIPEDLSDPDRTISYEQARRLGLINLDNTERDSG